MAVLCLQRKRTFPNACRHAMTGLHLTVSCCLAEAAVMAADRGDADGRPSASCCRTAVLSAATRLAPAMRGSACAPALALTCMNT